MQDGGVVEQLREALMPQGGRAAPALARMPVVARVVQSSIIPRLVLAHATSEPESSFAIPAGVSPGTAEVAALIALILANDLGGANAFIEALRESGTSPELLYLGLLAPAAVELGVMWEEDVCDFTQVTIGLVNLQHIMWVLSPLFQPSHDRHDHSISGDERRILLAPVPGEQHGFGLSMVAEFFRRAGWDVTTGEAATGNELVATVRNEWFSIVGFSASCDQELDALSAAIRAVRRASRNREVGIMVGGPIFIERPEFAALVGADATAIDGRQATLQAERLLALLVRRA